MINFCFWCIVCARHSNVLDIVAVTAVDVRNIGITCNCVMVFALETVPGAAVCSSGLLCALQELVFL